VQVPPVRVVTRRAALAAGATDRQLYAAVRENRLTRARRGVYAQGPPTGLTGIAAAAAAGGVVSHSSARVLWGIDGPSVAQVHRTVGRNWNGRRQPGETVHRARLDPGDTDQIDGVSVTTPLRTVLDEARVLPFEWAVAVADSALRLGLVTEDELASAARSARGRDASKIRRVVAFADGRSESVLESMARVALVLAGLTPQVQEWIGRIRVDLLIGNVVIELDGFAYHSTREDYRRDRRRCNALTVLGYRVLRFSWEDVVGDPAYMVAKVLQALELGA
jgi:very-short-patch-repair endonuclease